MALDLLLVKARIDEMNRLIDEGADMYRALRARLSDDAGRLTADPVIYAIQVIDDQEKAQSFIRGYGQAITQDPASYPRRAQDDPLGYAKEDIQTALAFHFTVKQTHEFWKRAIDSYPDKL
jgi:hypothetical protein